MDVLDRPDLCGGWEEAWRLLEMVEFFDLDQVVAYALLLDNATAIGKVGWFLQLHRDSLMVDEQHLAPLRERSPRQPRYVSRKDHGPTRIIPEWNLIVPETLAEQRWVGSCMSLLQRVCGGKPAALLARGASRDALSVVLPLTESEQKFLDRLLGHGEIRPALLGIDHRL